MGPTGPGLRVQASCRHGPGTRSPGRLGTQSTYAGAARTSCLPLWCETEVPLHPRGMVTFQRRAGTPVPNVVNSGQSGPTVAATALVQKVLWVPGPHIPICQLPGRRRKRGKGTGRGKCPQRAPLTAGCSDAARASAGTSSELGGGGWGEVGAPPGWDILGWRPPGPPTLCTGAILTPESPPRSAAMKTLGSLLIRLPPPPQGWMKMLLFGHLLPSCRTHLATSLLCKSGEAMHSLSFCLSLITGHSRKPPGPWLATLGACTHTG